MQCLLSCHMPLASCQTIRQKDRQSAKQQKFCYQENKSKLSYHWKWNRSKRSRSQVTDGFVCLKIPRKLRWEADVTRWKKLYIPLIIISSAATLKNHRWHAEDSSSRSRSRRSSLLWLVRDELQRNLAMIEWRLEEPETALCMLRCTFIDCQSASQAVCQCVSQAVSQWLQAGQTEINCSHYYNEITYLLNDKT